MKQKFIQFSKKIVVTVVASVNLFVALAMVMLYDMREASGLVEIVKYYLIFSGIVFVAYCGNSALEKWALSKIDIAQFSFKTNTTPPVG